VVKAPSLCQEQVTPPCQFPKTKRSTKWCLWHWLKRQPASVQGEFAAYRLMRAEKADGYAFRPRVPEAEWPEGHRWCSGCQTMVPMFYTSGSRCRACASKAAHENRVQDQYGLKPGEYREVVIEGQGNRCGICRARPITVRLAVDHNHQSGRFRGGLCSKCNHELLGAAHDSLPILLRAVAYLMAPPAQGIEAWKAEVERWLAFLPPEERPAADRPADPFSTVPARRGQNGPSRAEAGSPF
jgi:Recombination endonuclease VII